MKESMGKETPASSKYVRVEEVAQLCEVSKPQAYKIMRRLNKELQKQGYFTTSGRVSRKYLMERLYI